jgi:hypothetical protein
MSSTNLTLKSVMGLRSSSGVFLVLASLNGLSHAVTSTQSSLKNTASQPSFNNGKVTEGREAVRFYPDSRLTKNLIS